MLVESRDGLEPFDGRRRKTVAVTEDLVEVRNGDFQGVGVRGARSSSHREPEDSPVHSGPLPRNGPHWRLGRVPAPTTRDQVARRPSSVAVRLSPTQTRGGAGAGHAGVHPELRAMAPPRRGSRCEPFDDGRARAALVEWFMDSLRLDPN